MIEYAAGTQTEIITDDDELEVADWIDSQLSPGSNRSMMLK